MPYQPAVLGTARLNNFRLNYLTPALAAERPAYVWIILGGVNVSRHVLYKSVRVRDLVFDAPNTCAIMFFGLTPTVGQPLEIWVDSNTPTLLFGGELQTVEKTFDGKETIVKHPCTGIDDTARANRRRPLGLWTNTSATTIAQWLISTYTPGFSSAGVELGLPAITINFDGSEAGMKGCLTQIAKLIGGYWYFENKTLYLFQTPPGPAPDPIDDTPGRFLFDPPIKWTIDKSQVRTRVYGKGASTRLAAAVDATVAIVPVDEATMFNPTGGRAIAGVTPDGAASRVLTYTGVQLGGGGGLVGPGAAPSAVPGLELADGAGMESGVHQYAYTFTTAAGESLPSPVAAITVGALPAPVAAPTPGAPTAGGAVDAGTHYYAVTFVTAAGETTSSAGSAPVTTIVGAGSYYVPNPTQKCTTLLDQGTGANNQYAPGDSIQYYVVFRNANGTTARSPISTAITAVQHSLHPAGWCKLIQVQNIQVSGDPSVINTRIYRYRNGVSAGYTDRPPNIVIMTDDNANLIAGTAPTVNTALVPGANYQTVPLTGIPIGPANVTARKLYRYSGAGPYKFLATIANNTQTTYTDTTAAASLGAAVPGTNTATANQVLVRIAFGGATVTGRKIYRSKANLAPLQFLRTVGDNVTWGIYDAALDATLGAAPPAADTSGLIQPSGQVPAGSTSIIVANAAPFPPTGGWAIIGNGAQVIRYSAATENRLTGIPATGRGAIVASISYNSTITAAPALVGVAGLVEAVLQGSPIHVWVQRDDAAAQAHMIALDGGGDGIYEHIVSDERRSEASLIQVCDAELELYSRPLVAVVYASRDTKTKSGKTVTIATASPAIAETLTIQDVTITEIGVVKGVRPKYVVTASSVRHSFDAILRQLIRKAEA